MEVRRAVMDDVQDLFKIYKDAGRQKRPLNTYPIIEWIVQGDRVFLIAVTPKGRKAGFIIVREKSELASIDVIAVSKKTDAAVDEVRKELINAAIEAMKAKRLEYRGVKDDAFTKFLKANGFEKIDEIKDMYGSGKNGVLLVKGKQRAIPTKILQKRTETTPHLLENLAKLEEAKGDELGLDMYSDF